MRHDRVAHLHGILRSMSTVTRLFAASGACPFTDRARGRYGSAAGHQQRNQPSSSVAPPDRRRDRRSKSCRLPQPHNPNDPNCRRRSREISQRVHAHSSATVCCAIHPGTVRTRPPSQEDSHPKKLDFRGDQTSKQGGISLSLDRSETTPHPEVLPLCPSLRATLGVLDQ